MKAEAIMVTPKDIVCDGRPRRKGRGGRSTTSRAQNSALSSPRRTSPLPQNCSSPIAKGAHIIKYGEIIGGAQVDIPVGSWVSPT